MHGHLYTLPDCRMCVMAKKLLSAKGWEWREVPIDNPLVEYGVQALFKDRKVHAPVYVAPEDGVFIFLPAGEESAVFAKVISLKAGDAGVLGVPEPVGVA